MVTADRSGAAVVVVRHLTKSSSANGLYRGGGPSVSLELYAPAY